MNLPRHGALPLGRILLVVLLMGAGLALWKQTRPPQPTPIPVSEARFSEPAIQNLHQGTLPIKGGPPGYVGSDACKSCHSQQHESWHRSYHRTMTQALSRDSVRADFDNVILESNGERFYLTQTNDTYWVSIGDVPGEDSQPSPTVNLQLAMLTGSHHMQVFWLPGVYGNMQIGFPFTWLIKDRRWVPRPDTFIRDPQTEPVVEVWNQVCIRCHTTGGIPKPNAQEGLFESEVVDLGISCEACHGPGAEHVRLREAEPKATTPLPSEKDPIVQPAHLTAERSSQVCGACHGMKWFDKSEQWEAHGFRYRPGDDLNETTPIIQASKTDEQPWLHSVLERNPGLLESFFWSDGMIRVSGREYNGLLESACHTQGELSCLSCHSIHRSDPDDQLARNRSGNQACTQCHESLSEDISGHTHHSSGSSGSLCYNCHMPHTTYGILKAIRSHEIDSPSVESEIRSGRPNACNLCHVNQTLAWTGEHLHRWYGHPVPELSETDQEVPAIAKHLLQGDAGQRALAAWTLGWDSARTAAGDDWLAPLLARSLNDPYSAVRYIAAKSLQKLPGFNDFDYDFIASPAQRSAAVSRATEQWRAQRPAEFSVNPDIRFFDATGSARESHLDQLWADQDQTPVRLRE